MSLSSRVPLVILVACASGCGPSLMRRATTLAPQVVQTHEADAARPDTGGLVEVPATAAWNATVEGVRAAAAVDAASFEERTIATHWRYDTPQVAGGVAVQRRVRSQVHLNGADARTFSLHVSSEQQTRSRGTCAEATPWVTGPAAPDPAVAARAEESLARTRSVEFSELLFAEAPEQMLAVVQEIVAERWGLASTGAPSESVVRSEWRQTQAQGARVDMAVRSSVEVELRPVVLEDAGGGSRGAPGSGSESVPHGTQLFVRARLQWQGTLEEDETGWVDENSFPEVQDFYGRLLRRATPLRVSRPEVVPLEPRDPPALEVDLPAPPDPLRGSYALFIRAVQLPLHSPDGLDWDVGMLAGAIIRRIPMIARIAQIALAGPTSVLGFLLDAVTAAQNRGVLDQVAGVLANMVGRRAAPDIEVDLTLPTRETLGLLGQDNSHLAGWSDPIVIQLYGDVSIPWVIWDRDIRNHDLVGRGSFGAAELVNACAPVCRAILGGGQICAELRRQR